MGRMSWPAAPRIHALALFINRGVRFIERQQFIIFIITKKNRMLAIARRTFDGGQYYFCKAQGKNISHNFTCGDGTFANCSGTTGI